MRLRDYFRIAALLALVAGIGELFGLVKYKDVALPMSSTLALVLPMVTRFVLGVGALVVASKLGPRSGVDTHGRWIQKVLVIAAVLIVVNAVLAVVVLGRDLARGEIIRASLSLALTLALYGVTGRLSGSRGAGPQR